MLNSGAKEGNYTREFHLNIMIHNYLHFLVLASQPDEGILHIYAHLRFQNSPHSSSKRKPVATAKVLLNYFWKQINDFQGYFQSAILRTFEITSDQMTYILKSLSLPSRTITFKWNFWHCGSTFWVYNLIFIKISQSYVYFHQIKYWVRQFILYHL